MENLCSNVCINSSHSTYIMWKVCVLERERARVREREREVGRERGEYLFYAKQLSCQRWIIRVGIWALGNEHRAVRWSMSSPSALLLFTCRCTYLLYYHYDDQNPFLSFHRFHRSLPKSPVSYSTLDKVQVVFNDKSTKSCAHLQLCGAFWLFWLIELFYCDSSVSETTNVQTV